jgi:hypothetical protein
MCEGNESQGSSISAARYWLESWSLIPCVHADSGPILPPIQWVPEAILLPAKQLVSGADCSHLRPVPTLIIPLPHESSWCGA